MQERLARTASIGDLPRFGGIDQQALRQLRAGVAPAERRRRLRARPGASVQCRLRCSPIRLYNSLTRRVEPLEPLTPGRVTIYTCGSTVYRYAHIGNLRTYLFGDLLRRTLQYLGYEVLYVKNITDVGHMRETGEDPILLAAEVEGKTPVSRSPSSTPMPGWRTSALLNITPADVMPQGDRPHRRDAGADADAPRQGPRLRGGRQRLLRRLRLPGLRAALGAAARRDAGRPPRRHRARQARSRGLRALEAQPSRIA